MDAIWSHTAGKLHAGKCYVSILEPVMERKVAAISFERIAIIFIRNSLLVYKIEMLEMFRIVGVILASLLGTVNSSFSKRVLDVSLP